MIPTGQGVQGLSRGAYIRWGGISQLIGMPDHLHATINCSTWSEKWNRCDVIELLMRCVLIVVRCIGYQQDCDMVSAYGPVNLSAQAGQLVSGIRSCVAGTSNWQKQSTRC